MWCSAAAVDTRCCPLTASLCGLVALTSFDFARAEAEHVGALRSSCAGRCSRRRSGFQDS